ncbi:MAG: BamA/TamA family outer membrane protein, partial [Candidatus Neomarinimicrobiota bacterium]
LHLLYLGGSTSLRGWEMPGSFSESGGVAKWLLNVELRVPVWKMIGFEIFADAGGLSAFGEQDDPDVQWILGMDAGAGLLINTPLGPIRLDFAFPFYAEGTTLPPYAMQVAFLHTF